MGQMIMFPAWLGKHSTTMKNCRLLQELCCHMHLKSAAVSFADQPFTLLIFYYS